MDKNTPLQNFDDLSDSKTCAARLALLRAELKKRALDGFIVPRADEFQGEYVPARAERLAWLTAFTGSAGAAVVLADRCAIFVDGRYTLQVRAQTDLTLFEPRDLIAEGPAARVVDHRLHGRLDRGQCRARRRDRLRPVAAYARRGGQPQGIGDQDRRHANSL